MTNVRIPDLNPYPGNLQDTGAIPLDDGTHAYKVSPAQIAGYVLNKLVVSGTTRPVQDKLSDTVSVKDYGALGDGSTNDFAAFQAACNEATDVVVPEGAYAISQPVDTQGRQVNWHMVSGATIVGGEGLLRGTVLRSERRNRTTWGTYDQAAGYAICLHGDPERRAGVLGFTSDQQMAEYTERDSVALYADNIAPPPVHTTDAGSTYTATSVSFSNAIDFTKLKLGMIIDTLHSPKFSGRVVGWSAGRINVSGWYQTGNTSSGQIPPNGVAANVGVITSVWAMNANVSLYPNSTARVGHAFEVGTINDQAPFDPATQYPRLTAYDAVAFGSFGSWVGYYSRGPYYDAFRVQGAVRAGFSIENYGTGPEFGLYVEKVNCTPFEFRPDGFPTYRITADGNVEHGRRDLATTPYIDFHSSGFAANDFDARIQVQGGVNGTSGLGDMVFNAGNLITTNILPGTTNFYSIGSPQARFDTLYVRSVVADNFSSGNTAEGGSYYDFHVGGLNNDFDVRLLASGGTQGQTGSSNLLIQARNVSTSNLLPVSAGGATIGTPSLPYSEINTQYASIQGNLEIGTADLGPRAVDFHTGGNNNEYDVRLLASGGTNGQPGAGTLTVEAARINTPNLLPLGAGMYSIGTTALPYAVINAQYAAIQGNLTLGNEDTGVRVVDFRTGGNGNLYDARISADGGIDGTPGAGTIHLTAARTTTALLLPETDNSFSLGAASFRWTQIYAASGTINTSDEREKRDITPLSENAAGALVDAIPASTYRMKDGKRLHTGFVAQDVKRVLDEQGIDTEDFAGFVHDPEADLMGLRSDEMLALLWPVVQGLRRRVAELEEAATRPQEP